MISNEFEDITNLANGPIIFTYYTESELSISTIKDREIYFYTYLNDNASRISVVYLCELIY